MARKKYSQLQQLYRKSLKGLKDIFKRGRIALVVGLLASFGFLIVSGFLDLFPNGLSAPVKILIGVSGIIILGLIGIKQNR